MAGVLFSAFLAAYSFVLFILVFAFLPRPKHTGKIGMDIFGLVAGRFARVLKTRAAMGYLFFSGIQLRVDVCVSDGIVFCLSKAVPCYATRIRLGVCAEYPHDGFVQPHHGMAA